MNIFDFIWEEPIIPLDFTEEEVTKCKELAIKVAIAKQPELQFENFRKSLTMVEKGMVVSTLSVYFNKIVEEVKKNKNNNQQ